MQDSHFFDALKTQLKKHPFNLPDANVVLYQNAFAPKESNTLFKQLLHSTKWQQDTITLFGKTHDVPRLTALYGDTDKRYTYSKITMQPHPWNPDLLFVKKRVEALAKTTFTSCLLNLYRTGQDSNGWHQDNEKELGKNPVIASVSFGETRLFKLKHISNTQLKTVSISLQHGSVLLMQGTTQHFWKHQIPKTAKAVKPRINLTFRVIYPELA